MKKTFYIFAIILGIIGTGLYGMKSQENDISDVIRHFNLTDGNLLSVFIHSEFVQVDFDGKKVFDQISLCNVFDELETAIPDEKRLEFL